MATDDQQILVVGQAAAPATWLVPGNGQVTPRSIFAHFDGTGAASPFFPALKVVSDGGETIGIYPCATSVAVGGSADVSWFPDGGAGGTGGGGVGSTINVTDGTTSLTDIATLDFTRSLIVADGGGGAADLSAYYLLVQAPTGVAATDNANIQAAINACPTGGIVQLQAGTYAITGLTISKQLTLRGTGGADASWSSFGTRLTCASQTAVAIGVSGNGVHLCEFALQNTFAGTPTSASAGIQVTTGGGKGTHYGPYLSVRGFYINVDHQAGFEWTMDDSCFIYDFVHIGLRIQNVDLVDGGDMYVSGQFIAGPTNTSANAAITWLSGGGFRGSCIKINNRSGAGMLIGIDLVIVDGVSTGDFLLTNSSIENWTSYGILIESSGGLNTGTFRKVIINGCQFDPNLPGGGGHTIDIAPGATNQLSDVNVFGNVIRMYGGVSFGIQAQNTNLLSHGPNLFDNCGTNYNDAGGNTNVTSVGAG